ncbi:MAG: ABC transporter ATP-binding protein [Chloroflexi bacterium]|nr:ABC transporter ATP-binding protein [Chloroflexota bacterium]
MGSGLSQPPRIAVRGLRVIRGGRVVVDVPDLDIARGETLAIIGPNGAGKSTLLLHLALLERARTGEVRFDGEPTRGRELALRRRMAVVFQEALLLDRTALANVEAGLRLRGVPGRERRPRAIRSLARFGVEALAGRSARTLSGGEAQRVSLARAFALEPDVLFLDEPFAALDRPTRDAAVRDLAAALHDVEVTTIFVTHDHDEAARLARRVAVMIDGRIRQTGTPEAVFGAPSDPDVAEFVGIETIFVAAVVGAADGLVQLETAGQHIEAAGDVQASSSYVCLRPEDISIAGAGTRGADSARNRLRGRVTEIIVTGGETRVTVDCGVPLVARLTRRSADELELRPGIEVVASFKATAVHLIPRPEPQGAPADAHRPK